MKNLVYLFCFASACALAFAQDSKKAKTSSTAPAAAEQAARSAIDRAHEAFLAAMRANDPDALAKLQAPDVVFYPPNGSPVVGPEGVRRWFQAIVEKTRTTGVAISDRSVTLTGDRAIEEAQFVWTVVPVGGGAAIEDRGRVIAIWQRQTDGSWKVTRDIWNSSLPLPASNQTAAASPPADALLKGAWTLNVAKSRFNPGPAPRSETRTYSVTADGRQHAIYDNTDADGKRSRGESTFALDGKDAPVTGVPDVDAQAITRSGPRTLAAQIKKDGKVVRTAVREVSEDGQTLTLRFKGTNAKGQPLDDTWVFDRARTDGEWLSLRFTTVKPDMVAEFERLQKEELIPALKKAGVTLRGASSTATFGDGYVYAFGQPLKNLAELDEEDPLVKSLGAAGANALLTKLRACHVTTRVLGIRNVTDLSWDHNQPLPMFVVTRHELAPGRKAEWLAFMREHFVPAVRKSGLKQYIVQETVFGGNANEVYTLRFMERYGDLDTGGLRRQLGDDAFAQLMAKLPVGVVTQTERFVVRTRPELSLLPDAKSKSAE